MLGKCFVFGLEAVSDNHADDTVDALGHYSQNVLLLLAL